MITPDDFRNVLSHFASGVTIVTTCDGEQHPTGLTASAFCSVSLDPPMVLICVDHKSQSYPHIRDGGRFGINILPQAHEHLSRRFASSRLDKFDGVGFTMGTLGVPLIDGALAHLECRTASAHVEGDHTIFVGRVESIGIGDGQPLLYYRGKYHQLRGEQA